MSNLTDTELRGLQFGNANGRLNELFKDEVARWMQSTGKGFNPNIDQKGLGKSIREVVFSAHNDFTINKMQKSLSWALKSVELPRDEHYMSASYICKVISSWKGVHQERKSTTVVEPTISEEERERRDLESYEYFYECYKLSKPFYGVVDLYHLMVKYGIIPDNYLDFELQAKAKAMRKMSEAKQSAKDNVDRKEFRRLNELGGYDPKDIPSIAKEMAVHKHFEKRINDEL